MAEVESSVAGGRLGMASVGESQSSEVKVGTLRSRAMAILGTASAAEKCRLTRLAAAEWRRGELEVVGEADGWRGAGEMPRPVREVLEAPRGRAKQSGVKAFLHAVAHAECCAVDCFWDLAARFGAEALEALGPERAREFASDVVDIAVEEATHFERLAGRLRDGYGVEYGGLEAHDTLASSMDDTADDLIARLVVVHLVHEARGLDVFHVGRARLDRARDSGSVAVLDANYSDEIGHVKRMLKWFIVFARTRGLDPRTAFADVVRDPKRWRAQTLKPPFNHHARAKAGLPQDWYLPLADPPASPPSPPPDDDAQRPPPP